MKSWSLTILFAFVSVVGFIGCSQPVKSDPEFTRQKVEKEEIKDKNAQRLTSDYGA